MAKDSTQEIITLHLFPSELELEPEEVPAYDVDNHFKRTLSLMTGYDGTHEHLVAVTSDGALKVATVGGGFSWYKVLSGTTDDVTVVTLDFTKLCARFDFWIRTNNAKVSFRNIEDTSWGDWKTLVPGIWSIDYITQKIQIVCATAASSTTYELTGYA